MGSEDPGSNEPSWRIELRPNCSLTPKGALFFFGSLCALCFAIAGFWAWRGFWPVLPFAGLEMGVLGWALAWTMRRRHQLERVVISETQVRIESISGRRTSEVVFPRHWAKVTLRAPNFAPHPSRLLIESHGHAFEIGGFLTEDERRSLAARLRQLIGNVNSSPPLDGAAPAGTPAL